MIFVGLFSTIYIYPKTKQSAQKIPNRKDMKGKGFQNQQSGWEGGKNQPETKLVDFGRVLFPFWPKCANLRPLYNFHFPDRNCVVINHFFLGLLKIYGHKQNTFFVILPVAPLKCFLRPHIFVGTSSSFCYICWFFSSFRNWET